MRFWRLLGAKAEQPRDVSDTGHHSLTGRLRACRGVLVDSNVLLDVATNDPAWGGLVCARTRPSRRIHNPDHQSDHLCGSIDRLDNHRSSGGRSSSKFLSTRTASLGGRFPGGEEFPALPPPERLADLASPLLLYWCACCYRASCTAHT
jgi:hypothetical protein